MAVGLCPCSLVFFAPKPVPIRDLVQEVSVTGMHTHTYRLMPISIEFVTGSIKPPAGRRVWCAGASG